MTIRLMTAACCAAPLTAAGLAPAALSGPDGRTLTEAET